MKLLSEREISESFNINLATLRAQRVKNTGFPYKKIHSLVRYDLEEIEDFLKKNSVQTSDSAR